MTITHDIDVSPSVRHIVEVIAARIRDGIYPHGRWLPSEREISEEFGVSRIIVKSVIKELERRSLVARSARCRPVVQKGAGIDIPSVGTARRSIGLWIWPNPGSPGVSMIVQGINKTLDHDAFRLMISSPGEPNWEAIARSEAQFLQRMAQDQDIVGIILWYLGGETNRPTLERLREARIPLVFIDRRPPDGFVANYVGVDNEHAAEEVVRHLIHQGHRRIAHVSNFDTASTVEERLSGYHLALVEAGIPFRPELVKKAPDPPGQIARDGCEELIDTLLGLPDPPTAIFAVNDYIALRLLAVLRAREIQVPEEMAIAGFDGIERWIPGKPFLTTANQPFERMGARAVEMLLQHIDAGSHAICRHILLDAPLSIQASTRHALT